MDMKPLFRDSSPSRYPFVWQSRAAKFYNNSANNHVAGGHGGNHNSNSSRPESPHRIGRHQTTYSRHHSQAYITPSHHHSSHHHHQHQQQQQQNTNHCQPSPNKSAKPSLGSSLFSHSYNQAHPPSRRPFFPTPPAVAPKPLTATVTSGSIHIPAAAMSGNSNPITTSSSFPLLDAELSCSSSSPTGGESSSNFDHDDSQPFVRMNPQQAHSAGNRFFNSKMTRSYPDSHQHHSLRYHKSNHRQASPSHHHHYASNRCPIGLCQKLPSNGPTQFDPSRFSSAFDSYEYPLLQQYPTYHVQHAHPFSFYSTPELHSAGRPPYYLNSSPLAHRHHHSHAQHSHHHHPHHLYPYQAVPPPQPYFVPYTSRSHVHLPSIGGSGGANGAIGTAGFLGKKQFDNSYAAFRFYNEGAAKYRSSILNRSHHRLHNRRRCRGHLIVLSIILAVISVGVIMGVILAMTIN